MAFPDYRALTTSLLKHSPGPGTTEPRGQGFFLCTGMPKSGTTFLQRVLNAHPQVSCPAEHFFPALRDLVKSLTRTYGELLREKDRTTGGQGATLPTAGDETTIFGQVAVTLARSASRGKPIYGLNDNTVVGGLSHYYGLFGRCRIIVIVRNPVDQFASVWRRQRELARLFPDQANSYLAVFASPAETVEDYTVRLLPHYKEILAAILRDAAAIADITVVLYEALVADKRSQFLRIFDFLGATTGKATLERIVAGSSREAMARSSADPSFFALDVERPQIPPALRQRILSDCWPLLERVGYSKAVLMGGQ